MVVRKTGDDKIDRVGERPRQDSLESASGGFGTLIDVAVNLLLDQTGIAITRLMETADVEFRPSEHACVSAHQMLVHLNDTGFSIPASDVYADPDRAIRILWSKDGRNAELVFPSSDVDKAYIYHSDEREYGVEESPSPSSPAFCEDFLDSSSATFQILASGKLHSK